MQEFTDVKSREKLVEPIDGATLDRHGKTQLTAAVNMLVTLVNGYIVSGHEDQVMPELVRSYSEISPQSPDAGVLYNRSIANMNIHRQAITAIARQLGIGDAFEKAIPKNDALNPDRFQRQWKNGRREFDKNTPLWAMASGR